MNRSYLIICCLVFVGWAGCSPQPAAPGPDASPAESSIMVRQEPERPLDIGDVEFDMNLEITVPELDASAGITVEEMRTYTGDLTLTTINVPYPPPASLTLLCTMRYHNDYAANPVSADIRMFREDVIIENQGGIIAARMRENPLEFTVDALANLEEVPDTLLLHAELELSFFPQEGQSTLSTEKTTKLSNPVRINFEAPPAMTETPDAVEEENPSLDDSTESDEP